MHIHIRILYPSTKFVIALALGISAFLIPVYWIGFPITSLVFLIAWAVNELKPFWVTVRNTVLVLAIFMFVIRLLFTGGDNILWHWGKMSISTESISSATTITGGVLALASSLLLFFRITPVDDITAALENAGMSPTASYIVLSSIQMIPEMRKQATMIMDAQKCRGVETEGSLKVRARAFVPALAPLVLSSISSTEERVMTLESRGFTAPVAKTRLYQIKPTPVDKILFWTALILLIALVLWRTVSWML